MPGCGDPAVWTSDDLLGVPGAEAFDSLAIVGGGVIGVEMACIFARLGVHVTIIEAEKNCLPMLDRELSRGAEALLRSLGVDLMTGAKLTCVEKTADGFIISFDRGGAQNVVCERVLLATGRRPATDGLFGPGVSPAVERGAVVADADYQTSLPGVYAIGDVNGNASLRTPRTLRDSPPSRICWEGKRLSIPRLCQAASTPRRRSLPSASRRRRRRRAAWRWPWARRLPRKTRAI